MDNFTKAWIVHGCIVAALIILPIAASIWVAEQKNQDAFEATPQEEVAETSDYTVPNPCELDTVVCEDEQNSQIRFVSAYTSRVEETDETPCTSASGANICHMYLEDGTQICAMNGVPFGTILNIEGFGTCAVYDRMASHKNGWVDLYMGYDLEAAMNWGVRNVIVTEL